MAAPIPVIQLGIPTALPEDEVFAMPIAYTAGFSADPASTLEVSMDGSTWVAITVEADGSFYTTAPFIRCHNDDGTIIVKAY